MRSPLLVLAASFGLSFALSVHAQSSQSLDPCAPGCTVETCGICDPALRATVCGNGVIEYGEECDSGQQNGSSFCSASCTYVFLQCAYGGCGCYQIGAAASDVLGQVTPSKVGPDFGKNAPNNGSSAANEYGFYTPQGLAVDTKRHVLFVADKINRRIVAHFLSADNRIVDYRADAVFGVDDLAPAGMAVDTEGGRLYVVDTVSREIFVYPLSSPSALNGMQEAQRIKVLGLANPIDVVFSPAGYLYISDKVAPVGVVNRVNLRDGLAVSPEVEDPDVKMYGFISPQGLHFDESTRELYVADKDRHNVLVIDESGLPVVPPGGPTQSFVVTVERMYGVGVGASKFSMTNPSDVIVHGENVFVTDSLNHRVLLFDRDAPDLGAFSVIGQDDFDDHVAAVPPAQDSLNLPTFLAFLSGSCELLISDTFNHRIVVAGDRAQCTAVQSSSSITDPQQFDIVRAHTSSKRRVIIEFNMPVSSATMEVEGHYSVEGASPVAIHTAIRHADTIVELVLASDLVSNEPYQVYVRDAACASSSSSSSASACWQSGLTSLSGQPYPTVNAPFEFVEIIDDCAWPATSGEMERCCLQAGGTWPCTCRGCENPDTHMCETSTGNCVPKPVSSSSSSSSSVSSVDSGSSSSSSSSSSEVPPTLLCADDAFPSCAVADCPGIGSACKPGVSACECRTSCPFLYSWTGTGFVLENEAIPFSFMPAMEDRTYGAMPSLRALRGVVTMKVTEERDEVSYIDELTLTAVPTGSLPEGTRILPSADGSLHTVLAPQPAASCVTHAGEDCTTQTQSLDSDFADNSGDGKHTGDLWYELTFPRPKDGSDKPRLLLNVETHMSMDVVAYGIITRAGKNGHAFSNTLLNFPLVRDLLRRNMAVNGLYLGVEVWDGTAWRKAGDVKPGNYREWDDFLVPLDVPAGAGDELRVRLTTQGWYLLNRAAIDWSEDVEVAAQPLTIATAETHRGHGVRGLLTRADGVRHTIRKGEHVILTFDAPADADRVPYAYVASVRGYYIPITPTDEEFSFTGTMSLLMKVFDHDWVAEGMAREAQRLRELPGTSY